MSQLTITFNYAQNPDALLYVTLAFGLAYRTLVAVEHTVAAVAGLRRRRESRRLNAVYEAHGVTYRRVGSPPSHAAVNPTP